MKRSEWRLRFVLRLVQAGLTLPFAQQTYSAGKDYHDYNDSPEDQADDELSYMAGAQKELILALNGRSAFGWREILRERAKELRTKIAELEKKTDSTDNVLMGEDDQMGNYL